MVPHGKTKGFLCSLLSKHLFTNKAEAAGKSKPRCGILQPLVEIKRAETSHSPSPIGTSAEIHTFTFYTIS